MDQLFIEGFSAFAGAFFAFLFLRLAEFFTKIYKRKIKHYNSLVSLGTELNELGGIIHDNLYLIPFFRKAILKGNIYFNQLHLLQVNKSHYRHLFDIEIINELFSFNYQLRKINDDIISLTGGYSDIKNAFIAHDINKNDYLINAQITANHLATVEIFLNDLQKQCVKLLAKARLMLKKDIPLGTKIMNYFIYTSGLKISDKELNKETTKLLKEIEETITNSQKEIEAVLKSYKKL